MKRGDDRAIISPRNLDKGGCKSRCSTVEKKGKSFRTLHFHGCHPPLLLLLLPLLRASHRKDDDGSLFWSCEVSESLALLPKRGENGIFADTIRQGGGEGQDGGEIPSFSDGKGTFAAHKYVCTWDFIPP